jgi:hypothetical protein
LVTVPFNDLRLELKVGKSIVTNPTEVAEILNSYFTSNVEELVEQKKSKL